MENCIIINGIKHTLVKDDGSLSNCKVCSLNFCKNHPTKAVCSDVFDDIQGHFEIIEK